jgi:hypothetical protein
MLSICMTDHAMILYFEAMNTLSLDFDDKIYRCDSSVSVSYSWRQAMFIATWAAAPPEKVGLQTPELKSWPITFGHGGRNVGRICSWSVWSTDPRSDNRLFFRWCLICTSTKLCSIIWLFMPWSRWKLQSNSEKGRRSSPIGILLHFSFLVRCVATRAKLASTATNTSKNYMNAIRICLIVASQELAMSLLSVSVLLYLEEMAPSLGTSTPLVHHLRTFGDFYFLFKSFH